MKYNEKIDLNYVFGDEPEEGEHNFDDMYEMFSKAITNADCCTCKWMRRWGTYTECKHPTLKIREVDPFNGADCAKRNLYSRWSLNPLFDIEWYFHKYKDINTMKDEDLYEVYEYRTGEVLTKTRKEKKRFMFWEVEYDEEYQEEEVFYYIVKNQKYFYCAASKKDFEYRIEGKYGFIPLTDFRRLIYSHLIKWNNYQDAVKEIEKLDCKKAEKGMLIYSTYDSLENKFIQLEHGGKV